jgi:hypothetical protein
MCRNGRARTTVDIRGDRGIGARGTVDGQLANSWLTVATSTPLGNPPPL